MQPLSGARQESRECLSDFNKGTIQGGIYPEHLPPVQPPGCRRIRENRHIFHKDIVLKERRPCFKGAGINDQLPFHGMSNSGTSSACSFRPKSPVRRINVGGTSIPA